MSKLETYHGASTIMRKTIDWNLSRRYKNNPSECNSNVYVFRFLVIITTFSQLRRLHEE
jgi:hypothetical protein